MRAPGRGLAISAPAGCAGAAVDTEDLPARETPPQGLVLETVAADEDALRALLPRVRESIERIRARFPQTESAVVSHGREEFARPTARRDEFAEAHGLVRGLAADEVPVPVCATHAGRNGVTAEDFSGCVDVAPAGPGRLGLFEEPGYERVVVY